MSVRTATTVRCDHLNESWRMKRACTSHIELAGMSSGLARLIAREENGWISIRGKDYCSVHASLHPTHGTVEEEMLANGYVKCECGKVNLPTSPTCSCGQAMEHYHGGCR